MDSLPVYGLNDYFYLDLVNYSFTKPMDNLYMDSMIMAYLYGFKELPFHGFNESSCYRAIVIKNLTNFMDSTNFHFTN